MLKTLETLLGHWYTFVKAHEKIIVVAIAGLLLWHFGDKAFDAYTKHLTDQQAAINKQIVDVEKTNAALVAKLDQLKTTVDAQAKVSQAKIVAAKQKLVEAQKIDAALPLPALSKHWEDLLVLTPGSITPEPSGTVSVTTDAAHATVNELEKIEPLTIELAATQEQLAGCTVVRAQQDSVITGLNTNLDLQKQGRAADAKVAADAQKKSYLKGLKHGIIIGVVATVAAAVAILK